MIAYVLSGIGDASDVYVAGAGEQHDAAAVLDRLAAAAAGEVVVGAADGEDRGGGHGAAPFTACAAVR